MSKTMKNIPKLRFPEFRDAPEWDEKRIDSIANVVASGDLDSECFSPIVTDTHIYPIYSNAVVQEGLYGYCTYSKYEKNSVTITARGTLGVAFVRNHEFVGIGRLLVASNLKDILPYFLKESWNYLAKIPLENGGIPQLTAITAKAVVLPIPQPEEQQKIAECLSSLDALILAQSSKVEALKAHKKALMQQLFPAEGETTPLLRFPEFRDAPEWEEKQIGDVSKIYGRIGYRGYTVNDIVQKGQGAIALSPSNITNDEINLVNLTYVSWEKYEESPEIKVENGDILFVKTGSTYGKTAIVSNLTEKATVNPQIVIIKEILINKTFLSYVIASMPIKKQVEQIVVGGAVPTMSQKELAKMIFLLPSKEEQQKIAECLSSLDALISAQSSKVEALKQHKKALMQQLFPTCKVTS